MGKFGWLNKIKNIINKKIDIKSKIQLMWKWILKILGFVALAYLGSLLIMIFMALLASISEMASKTTNIPDKTVWLNVNAAILASLVGAYAAVHFSLNTQRKIDKQKEDIKNKLGERMMLTFLKPEIYKNFNIIGLANDRPEYLYGGKKLIFDEYQQIKYSLVEYPSEIIKDIINLYGLFYDYEMLPGNSKSEAKIEKVNEILKLKQIIEKQFTYLEKST